MKKFLIPAAVAALVAVGCSSADLAPMENRIGQLEKDVATLKSDVAKLQEAVEKSFAIIDVKRNHG